MSQVPSCTIRGVAGLQQVDMDVVTACHWILSITLSPTVTSPSHYNLHTHTILYAIITLAIIIYAII